MPTPAVVRLLPLVAIVALALGVRTWELARRPMHADEANQAVKTGVLLERGDYRYDPSDHHGPTLYYAALPMAWLRGETTLAGLSEVTLRLVPALHGAAAVALLGWLVAGGRATRRVEVAAEAGTTVRSARPASAGSGNATLLAALAAAFLAISPAAVYYSRYFVQETLLVTYLILGALATVRWWQTGRTRWCVTSGIAAGLALATKESAIVFLTAAALGAAIARPPRPVSRRIRRDAGVAVVTALVVALLFYTSFGSHPGGMVDAWRGLTQGTENTADARGHTKPWWYYLQLLAWQKNGGLVWHQVLFTTLALIGGVAAWARRIPASAGTLPLLRGCSVFVVLMLLALSVVPYKTPWNLVGVLPALAVLAAGGLLAIARLRTGRIVAVAFAFLAFVTLLGQLRLAVFQRAADARNPYAYVHSAPDVLKYRAVAAAARAAYPNQPIQVIGDEYWPLPWYLRGLDGVGYWPTPPTELGGSLLIVAGDQADAVRARLTGRYRERFLGLRPGYANILFVRDEP